MLIKTIWLSLSHMFTVTILTVYLLDCHQTQLLCDLRQIEGWKDVSSQF